MGDLLKGFSEGLLGNSGATALERLGRFASEVVLALLIAVVTLLVGARVRDAIHRSLKRSKADPGLAILLGRVGYIIILLIGLVLVLQVFNVNVTTLAAALGVVGLAVSLAAQDVLRNAFAGIYLLIERPFRPGETIKVRDFVGVVETIDLRTTTLRANGEVIYVPNAILFAEVLVNRGAGTPTAGAPSEGTERSMRS
ncbi:MAG: mechanosensitive ion channel [Chloroflexi bacterium]|nr:mechanosensitive ion channel [Chloroflexota bacterium]